jgi:hypothetical protein
MYIHNPGRGAGERENVCREKEKGYKERKGNKEYGKLKCAEKKYGTRHVDEKGT